MKLWASGQSDAFLLLLLGFTAELFIHFACYPSSVKTSLIILYLCQKFPSGWFV